MQRYYTKIAAITGSDSSQFLRPSYVPGSICMILLNPHNSTMVLFSVYYKLFSPDPLCLTLIYMVIIIIMLQARKLRAREVTYLDQGHLASNRELGFKPRLYDSRGHALVFQTNATFQCQPVSWT